MFLNPLMLLGLTGLALPVLVHLLSRRRYDIVDWGAMRFLELAPNARRRIRLEELLLLLVRMLLMGVMAVALARPWVPGNWLGRWGTPQNRDVVILIDGSASMGWEGRAETPHAAARRLAEELIDHLLPGDTLAVYDVREQPRPLLPTATRDFEKVRAALAKLPRPQGVARLGPALNAGLQALNVGTNLRRELVLLTDDQALTWTPDDRALWLRVQDQLQQTTIAPRLWVVRADELQLGATTNFTVERLQLSRELAVPGLPVRITAKIRRTGGEETLARRVFLEINGQRIAEETQQIRLAAGGETTVTFERRFSAPGSQLVSVVLEADDLPADNQSDAAVQVVDALPVLLIDGDPHRDPTRSETFFAQAALAPKANPAGNWMRVEVLGVDDVTAAKLSSAAVIVAANVRRWTAPQREALQAAVTAGRGLLVTLGDQVDPLAYNQEDGPATNGLLPVELVRIGQATGQEEQGVRIADSTLELPWLAGFRGEQGGSLVDARFSRWWVTRFPAAADAPGPAAAAPPVANPPPAAPKSLRGQPTVAARLSTQDPWLIYGRFGQGTVGVLTSSLDADWNTLPAKPDYVPWLHELIFSLAAITGQHNVEVGQPLSGDLPADWVADRCQFRGPNQEVFPAQIDKRDGHNVVRLPETTVAGVYHLESTLALAGTPPIYFVANPDRTESDLTRLTDEQWTTLQANDRLKAVPTIVALRDQFAARAPQVEIWTELLYVFLGLLLFEVWLTRRRARNALAIG